MTQTVAPHISLIGKTALIAGASQGIGLAVARLFVRYGAQAAMIDHSGRSFKEAEQLGVQVIAVRCNVAGKLQVKGTVAALVDCSRKNI